MNHDKAFFYKIGPFPTRSLERHLDIHFSDLEKEVIQIWYRCYLANAWERHLREKEVLPSACHGTPEEVFHIFDSFGSLRESERKGIFLEQYRTAYSIFRWGFHFLKGGNPFTFEESYRDIVETIRRKITEANHRLYLEKKLAVTMGTHPRLGKHSTIRALPHDLLQKILR